MVQLSAPVPSVAADVSLALLGYLERRGVPSEELPRLGERAPPGRLPLEADLMLWRRVGDLIGPDAGLRFAAEAVDADTFGVLGYLLRSSSGVQTAVERLVAHDYAVRGDGETRLADDGERIFLTESPPTGRWPPSLAEALLAAHVVLVRRWTGLPLAPLAVHLQHARSAPLEAYERLFACPVHFSQPKNQLVFSRDWYAHSFRQADAGLCRLLEGIVAQRLAELRTRGQFLRELEDTLRELLPAGEASAQRAAQRLGLTSRTLQRRLQARGLSLRDVLDRVRAEQATARLCEPGTSLSHLAESLGFSDDRAFRRAFRRWTGLSPREYRRARLF
jgi:AraC-like DNA-binding protein